MHHHRTPHDRPALFARLDQGVVSEIMAAAERWQVEAGQIVQAAGQPGTHLSLICKGRVRYYNTTHSGEEIALRILAPGDVIGLVALLSQPMCYMASVDAVSDCELLSWEHKKIRDFATAYPQIPENALQMSLRYLKAYTSRHSRLVSGTANGRLAATILDLANRTGTVGPNGIEIEATNEQLGSLSDISRFTTSRLLNGWQRQGTVSKARGKLVVQAPEGLTRP